MVFDGHFQQYFSNIVAVSFFNGRNPSTRKKQSICRKSLKNFTFPGTRVSTIKKTDRNDITEILLKVAVKYHIYMHSSLKNIYAQFCFKYYCYAT
jgi:hypothetical protein